jgi:protein-arginine kinase activator protein McsA
MDPTAANLIAELDAEATRFKIVLLVVIFPEAPTVFIRSDRTNRFGALTAALAHGGEAIGFIATRDQGESVFLFGRVLRGLEAERAVSQYLASLNDEVTEMLRQETYESSPKWVN